MSGTRTTDTAASAEAKHRTAGPRAEFAAIEHPCYDSAHKSSASRLHLPVAPRCNVQCRFCDRSFDCVNESRPGVTAALLTPYEALERVDRVRERLPNLKVVGIAGPGDPLANPKETLESFLLVRGKHPDLALCLATNGLGLPGQADKLAAAGVSHLTLTVNAIDPEVGRRIYSWVRIDGRARTGAEAAKLLLERQMIGLEEAAAAGLVIKINTILIPGVNEGEVEAIAKETVSRGASFMNVIPLLPVKGTPLEYAGEPTEESLAAVRKAAAAHMPQLSHCARCRADAAGLLGKDIALGDDAATAPAPIVSPCASGACPGAGRPVVPRSREAVSPVRQYLADGEPLSAPARPGSFLVAAASREGLLVNRHLGEADRLFVFRVEASGEYETIDIRTTPGEGSGPARWAEMADLISDCSMVLTSGIGAPPRRILEDHGMTVHVLEGLIGEALESIAAGKDLSFFGRRTCAPVCSGGANRGCGCA